MKHRKIRNVMTTDVATVTDTAPFKYVAKRMADWQVSALPVVDDQRHVLGVVSQSDLLATQTAQADDRRGWLHRWVDSWWDGSPVMTTAGDLMTTPARTIGPDSDVVAAAQLLDRYRIKRLPVVDEDGVLVGIVSRRDLLTVFLRGDGDIRDEIAHEVFERNVGIPVTPATVQVQVCDGVATLRGQLERRSMVGVAESLVRRVDGVVDVQNYLGYRRDDTHDRMPDAMAVNIALHHRTAH